ncbi:hypothetical protein BBJ28_00009536 [Nothophytophthora sp. Chile5]|nr:hypothetical protein BBJ28_00009536 [Nothophytophthora sp. Chile5]
MGTIFSRQPVTVSPQTHHFQSTTQAGTLVYAALSKKKHRVNPITDSRRIDNSLFFGLKVPLDDIEIESQIGKGTFGVVYKAFYKGKHVALKRLLAQRYSAKTVQDFKNELSILSILQHPSIVQFLGAVLEVPTLCLLTELCAGSLADLLQLARNKELNITWGLTLEIALDCAKACAYLHALNPAVLHRDIKNLLITEDFRCKLSDFGLSRSLDKNANAQTMCGTPRWLAPEVFRGEDYSEKIDVYSYGIVLWELFCFKKPYLDKDAINLAYLVAHEDLRPELLPHIPEILHRLMKACWDADPAQRPSFSTVIFLIEEAKNAVPLGLAIDLSKSFSEATTPHRHVSTRPKAPSVKKHYGLTSGLL